MNNIIIGLAIAATTVTACNNNNTTSQAEHNDMHNDTAMHEHTTDTVANQSASTTVAFPSKEIIASYLQLKNALSKDNGKDAATAGNAIAATLSTVDMKSLSKDQMKSYMDIADDLKEHAEHI